MTRHISYAVLLGLALGTNAYAAEEKELDLGYVPQAVQPLMDSGQNEETKKLMQQAQEVISTLNLRPDATPDMLQQGGALMTQARELTNAALAEKRKKILTSMGIPEERQNQLYYFVSWSMPLDMLRAYALDAMWSGGTLVLRGFPKDTELGDFITKELPKVVGYKGATAAASLDPRLFDAYKVDVVPTIIYSEAAEFDLCTYEIQKTSEDGNAFWAGCGPTDENKYWKMAGAVTSDFALNAFIEDGADGAKLYLDLLAKGVQPTTGQAMQPFTGDWDTTPTPEVLAAMKETATAGQEVYMTPYGAAVGPAGAANEEGGLTPIDVFLKNRDQPLTK